MWYVFWLFLAYDSPEIHPRISASERKYIITSLSTKKTTHETSRYICTTSIYSENVTYIIFPSIQVPVPWFQIMTSPPFLAITVVSFCNGYGFNTMLTCMPLYFAQALNLTQDNVKIVQTHSHPFVRVFLHLPCLHNSLFLYLQDAIIENGLYSSIPYVASMLIVFASGPIADLLRAKCFSTSVVRKLFTCARKKEMILNAYYQY